MNFIVTFTDKNIRVNGTKDKLLFSAKDVCQVLGLNNTKKAIMNLNENQRVLLKVTTPGGIQKCNFITEGGLWKLVMRSNKSEALKFQDWLADEVIPCIHLHGQYPAPTTDKPISKVINLYSEDDLHKKVIQFIRTRCDDMFIVVVPLGENQDSSEKRIESYQKGYTAGVPDIILQNPCGEHSGLCIELKSPKTGGIVSDAQKNSIEQFKQNGFKTLISNDYDHIVCELIDYKNKLIDSRKVLPPLQKKYCCPFCNKNYTSANYFKKHLTQHMK
jgi:prophage antirepressor-like protein